MILYTLTWEEVAKLNHDMVALIPFGSVEQHSLHLPLGTDSMIAEGIASRLEAKLRDQVLLLPVVWLGCSPHHADFSGSLTAEIDTFIKTGEEIVSSLAHHGFRKFILLNGHAGNSTKLEVLAEKLRYRHNSHLKVAAVTYWHLIKDEIQAIRETPLGGMGHACEFETSLMLATHPELVRTDRMEKDGPCEPSIFETRDMFAPGSVTVMKAFSEISRHGGFGDPTNASAEKGEKIMEAVLSKLTQVVEEIRSEKL